MSLAWGLVAGASGTTIRLATVGRLAGGTPLVDIVTLADLTPPPDNTVGFSLEPEDKLTNLYPRERVRGTVPKMIELFEQVIS